MTEKKVGQALLDLISPNTKHDKFVEAVDEVLTPEEKQKLGEGSANKVVDSLSYLAAFAPAPATFDKQAFMFTGGADLENSEADTVWSFLNRTGLVNDESKVAQGRASVSTSLVQMLQDASNGFLTED
jgi:hypothetical protein